MHLAEKISTRKRHAVICQRFGQELYSDHPTQTLADMLTMR